jgi:hypothetical protein
MLSAAVLKTPAALRSASSLPPRVSWALNACTETMGAGLVTVVAERAGAVVAMVGSAPVACAMMDDAGVDSDGVEDSSMLNSSFAWVISPRAVLDAFALNKRTYPARTTYKSWGRTSTRIL